MPYYTIEPEMRREARTISAENVAYPVGAPFEHDGDIESLRDLLPGREIKRVSARDNQLALDEGGTDDTSGDAGEGDGST